MVRQDSTSSGFLVSKREQELSCLLLQEQKKKRGGSVLKDALDNCMHDREVIGGHEENYFKG